MQSDIFGEENVILNITREAYRHRRRSMFIGGLLIFIGLLAIIFPLVMSLAAELLAGIVLTAAGVVEFIHAFQCRSWRTSLVNGLTGFAALAFGLLFLLYPLTGVVSLALLLGVLFFLSGVVRISLALRIRPYDGWGWLLTSGVVGIVLAILIGMLLPQAAAWVLGVMLGVDLMIAGWWLLRLAISANKIGTQRA